MRWACCAGKVGMIVAGTAFLVLPARTWGQTSAQAKATPNGPKVTGSVRPGPEIQAIDDEYSRQLLQLDRTRLEQLGRLASSQKPAEAAATYERLFRLAIANDLFKDAEAAAAKVIETGTPSSATDALAHLVKIIAEVDRGAVDESLQSLGRALAESTREQQAIANRAVLTPGEVIEICEAYYQRLVDRNQYAVASKAFRLVLEQPYRPALKEFLASRLKRIELVGQPAPPIAGTDLDGKAFSLSAERGKVVLVVFWASWCLPNAAEVSWLEEVDRAYHDRGLRVVGINLDVREDGGQKLETALPNIRRFLLDYNVSWPTLVNGSGDHDHASAYGISDIPANVLIGRDGKVLQIDLTRKNLENVLAGLLGM